MSSEKSTGGLVVLVVLVDDDLGGSESTLPVSRDWITLGELEAPGATEES